MKCVWVNGIVFEWSEQSALVEYIPNESQLRCELLDLCDIMVLVPQLVCSSVSSHEGSMAFFFFC
jgi:hypothetical protein